jgi:hypothetical protein
MKARIRSRLLRRRRQREAGELRVGLDVQHVSRRSVAWYAMALVTGDFPVPGLPMMDALGALQLDRHGILCRMRQRDHLTPDLAQQPAQDRAVAPRSTRFRRLNGLARA